MIEPGSSRDDHHDKDERSNNNPPDNSEPPNLSEGTAPSLSSGHYPTDTFFDRFAAYYQPKSARLKPEVLEQIEDFNQQLISLAATVPFDYPDSDVSSRLSSYQHSEGKGVFRILEVNDSEGAYYLPPLEALSGTPSEKAERFMKGEVRVVHQPVVQRISATETRIRNRVEAFFDQESLEEAIDHMRDEMMLETSGQQDFSREPSYSYMKERMEKFVLKAMARIGSDGLEELMGEEDELRLNLVDLDTRPLPDGVVLRMMMMTNQPGRFLYFQFRATLNSVGKLTIEDIGLEVL